MPAPDRVSESIDLIIAPRVMHIRSSCQIRIFLLDIGACGMKALFSVLFAVALAGCTTVRTDVEAYSTISEIEQVGKVFIAPYNREDASSLQWLTNAGIFRSVLEEKGIAIAERRSEASSIAYLGFAVDEGETVQSTYSIPQYGVTGYSGSQTTGSIYGSSYSANTTYTPTYGVTGYSTGTKTSVIYTRGMAVDIVDARNNSKVFEAISVSRGSCSSFAGVARPIIEATLANFPKGKVGSVEVSIESAC
ncbi:hypothetical protein [uncultured Roseobacter sp.]|uniref:hypothetical protein n=1 Tax=uncultured Roseobacter sp. TaxID=114847 RepID=UPI00261084D4|nr:hypothetical protein [uncultured Roseobacter sp.]